MVVHCRVGGPLLQETDGVDKDEEGEGIIVNAEL